MSNLGDANVGAGRTRRSLTKAAGLAFAGFLALSARPRSAEAWGGDDDNEDGGRGCFLRGTQIRTTHGYRRVEDLVIGDFLPTVFGRVSRIQRIARHDFARSGPSEPWSDEARPVRIARSALDDNVPHADLYLTASHALFIDGVLVPAGDLLNGMTITLDEADGLDRLDYFHVELKNHDVIEAEGAPCETLLEVEATDKALCAPPAFLPMMNSCR
jgi:hypothetical protein